MHGTNADGEQPNQFFLAKWCKRTLPLGCRYQVRGNRLTFIAKYLRNCDTLVIGVHVHVFRFDLPKALEIGFLGHSRKSLSRNYPLWYSLKAKGQPFRVTSVSHA